MSVHYTEGIAIGSNLEGEVRLSKEMLRGNLLIAGRSGAGKTVTLLHIVQELLLQQEANDSLVLIDSHSDLTRQLLPRIPEPLTDRVRLVDLGNNRVPLLNPLDPRIFPNPEVLTKAVRDASKNWGSRVDDILNHCLRALCSFNSHPETKADETLTMLELPRLWNRQAGILAELSAFQQYVLSRDADPENERWFRRIAQWPLDFAIESVGPLNAWMEQLTRDPWTRATFGQNRTAIVPSEILDQGLILLICPGSGRMENSAASFFNSLCVSMFDAALRTRYYQRGSAPGWCYIAADEIQVTDYPRWTQMAAESRKYGAPLLVTTQAPHRLARVDGLLDNFNVLLAYPASARPSPRA